MRKYYIAIFITIFSCTNVFSQAGNGVYQFLDLPVSSRLAAMGGSNISLKDNDLNFAFRNPALLTTETDNVIGLNMANYLSDIKFGSFVYGKNLDNKNYFAIGIQYLDYGIFKETNDVNLPLGEFTAKDMALNIIYARPLTNRINVGATLKPIYSVYEKYTSFGVAMDLGANYDDKANLFSAGLVLRNIGTQIKGYYSDEYGQHYESLPFEIQLGLSKKFAHAPLRVSITLNELQNWDLSYNSTNQTVQTFTSSNDDEKISFIDMCFRHSTFAFEFLPTNSFYLIAAYNHRRHQEMIMPGFKSMTGFSFGGGIKLYKFQVGFGTTQFQKGNTSYQFSISTSLNQFRL